jgi:hypothetical protein
VSAPDEGVGLPGDFESSGAGGLGLRLATAPTRQAGATLGIERHSGGSEFVVEIPSIASRFRSGAGGRSAQGSGVGYDPLFLVAGRRHRSGRFCTALNFIEAKSKGKLK